MKFANQLLGIAAILLALDQRDIDEDLVKWQLLSFSNQIPALVNGQVDVIGLIQPYQTYLEDEYGDQVRVLFNDYDDVYGERHVSLIFINRVWGEAYPDRASSFVAGISDAINWIEANQDEAKLIISKYTQIPAKSVSEYHFTPDGSVRMQDIEAWMEYLKERGDLTAEWLTPQHVATTEYHE